MVEAHKQNQFRVGVGAESLQPALAAEAAFLVAARMDSSGELVAMVSRV